MSISVYIYIYIYAAMVKCVGNIWNANVNVALSKRYYEYAGTMMLLIVAEQLSGFLCFLQFSRLKYVI